MRNIIFILALLCTVYALEQDVTDSSLSLERLVDIETAATKAVLYGLLFFNERMSQNLDEHFNKLKTEAFFDIHNIINEAFEDVNLFINKGKEEGKNVDGCYYYAKDNLESKNTNAIAGLEMCIQNSHTIMERPLANLANSIQTAQKLLNDLNAIIPNCNSTNFLKKQACVMKNLLLTRESLKRVASNSGEAITTATVTYAKALINVKTCIMKNTAETRTFSTDIVIYTSSCIKNAPKHNPISEPSTSDKLLSTV